MQKGPPLNPSHSHLGELHGITVVVSTTGPHVYVGRCQQETDTEIILQNVDVHEEGQDGLSKDEFIRKTFDGGIWPKIPHLTVPNAEIEYVKPLGEFG